MSTAAITVYERMGWKTLADVPKVRHELKKIPRIGDRLADEFMDLHRQWARDRIYAETAEDFYRWMEHYGLFIRRCLKAGFVVTPHATMPEHE